MTGRTVLVTGGTGGIGLATAAELPGPDAATWTVLANPEGNEFCVLHARQT